MDTSMISRVLWQRHTLRRHERWNQKELREHQRRDVTAQRGFARAHSPFYRHLHAGFEGAPLGELPVLTKATLMNHFHRHVRLVEGLGQDVPDPYATMKNDMAGMGAGGIMSGAQMHQLETVGTASAGRVFFTLMPQHHQGPSTWRPPRARARRQPSDQAARSGHHRRPVSRDHSDEADAQHGRLSCPG
jgi:hypothetical protein